MKLSFALAMAAVVCGLAGRAPQARGQSAPTPTGDAALQQQVQAALNAQSTLPMNAIRAQVSGGVVTLQGVVADAGGKKIAEQAAQAVPGVRGLRDQIEINTSGAVTAAAEAAPAPAGYPYTELQLQSKVVQALMDDPHLNAYALTASIDPNHNVELNGTVPDAGLKAMAAKVVGAIPGIHEVTNDISVVAGTPPLTGVEATPSALAIPATTPESDMPALPPPGPDSDLVQSRIVAAFAADPAFSGLSCTVSGRDVTLAGEVTTKAERKRAMQVANYNAAGYKIHDFILIGH